MVEPTPMPEHLAPIPFQDGVLESGQIIGLLCRRPLPGALRRDPPQSEAESIAYLAERLVWAGYPDDLIATIIEESGWQVADLPALLAETRAAIAPRAEGRFWGGPRLRVTMGPHGDGISKLHAPPSFDAKMRARDVERILAESRAMRERG